MKMLPFCPLTFKKNIPYLAPKYIYIYIPFLSPFFALKLLEKKNFPILLPLNC